MRRLILVKTLHQLVNALMSHPRLTIFRLLMLLRLLLTEAKLLDPTLVSLDCSQKKV